MNLFLGVPTAAHTAAPRGDGHACHSLVLPPEVSLLPPGRGVASLRAGARHRVIFTWPI